MAQSVHGYKEPLMNFEDIGNLLSFLTVSEQEKENIVLPLINELEPIVKKLRLK